MADPKKQPGLKVNQILLEDATFSHCEDWLSRSVPAAGWPDLPLQIAFRLGRSADGNSALIGVQVSTIDNPENSPRYKFKVAVTGVIERDDEPNIPPDEYALTAGASLLFPFLREIVANITMRGRFGPIFMKPFNVKVAVQEVLRDTHPPSRID